jgi:hypothetical protein
MTSKISDLTEMAWTDLADDDNFEVQDVSAGGTGSKRIELLELQKAVRRNGSTYFNVKDFGAVGDGTTDDTTAILAAIAAYGDGDNGPTVYFPKGIYKMTAPIELKRMTKLIGHGSGRASGEYPVIYFYNCSGVTINTDVTFEGAVVAAGTSASGSVIEGLMFRFSGTPITGSHGIWVRGRVYTRDVAVWGFYDGIKIVATEGSGLDATEGNAEGSSFENTLSVNNTRHGFYLSGDNAGRIIFNGADGNSNASVGFQDDSTGKPNTYIACHTATNTVSSYRAQTSAPVAHMYIGCYAEWDQPNGDADTPAMFIGGFASRIDGTATYWGAGRLEEIGVDFTASENAERSLAVELGKNDRALSFHAEGDTAIGWGFKWVEDNKNWWEFGHASGGIAYVLTTGATDDVGYTQTLDTGGPLPEGRLGFYDDPLVYKGSNVWGTLDMSTVLQKASYTGSAAPTTGTWLLGDVVWNTAPTSGGTLGWICTTAGTPGTWKVFGSIA